MTTRVVHCKREPFDVYIGRGVGCKWGNPFVMDRESQRAEVIQEYRAWLPAQIKMGRLDPTELRGKVLGCFCAPKPCHGDVLAEFADRAAPAKEQAKREER